MSGFLNRDEALRQAEGAKKEAQEAVLRQAQEALAQEALAREVLKAENKALKVVLERYARENALLKVELLVYQCQDQDEGAGDGNNSD